MILFFHPLLPPEAGKAAALPRLEAMEAMVAAEPVVLARLRGALASYLMAVLEMPLDPFMSAAAAAVLELWVARVLPGRKPQAMVALGFQIPLLDPRSTMAGAVVAGVLKRHRARQARAAWAAAEQAAATRRPRLFPARPTRAAAAVVEAERMLGLVVLVW
ncbi:hypothetical protein UFOVP672_4 [uncultured Caudovirales phage]|uniref:Uncharacterized protein n=1 Tax=uncultured Caudovirales phage TaxID=2100421 RepID=A0A6J5N6Z4_9CAUD|nr:hypothetical protein UFOVP672_4 [uncultured Caudovirales phage]